MDIFEGGVGRVLIGGAAAAVVNHFLPKKYKFKTASAFILGGAVNYMLPTIAPGLGLSGWGPMEGFGDHALYGPTHGNPMYGQGGNPMRLD